jgi:hypothetical protein
MARDIGFDLPRIAPIKTAAHFVAAGFTPAFRYRQKNSLVLERGRKGAVAQRSNGADGVVERCLTTPSAPE